MTRIRQLLVFTTCLLALTAEESVHARGGLRGSGKKSANNKKAAGSNRNTPDRKQPVNRSTNRSPSFSQTVQNRNRAQSAADAVRIRLQNRLQPGTVRFPEPTSRAKAASIINQRNRSRDNDRKTSRSNNPDRTRISNVGVSVNLPGFSFSTGTSRLSGGYHTQRYGSTGRSYRYPDNYRQRYQNRQQMVTDRRSSLQVVLQAGRGRGVIHVNQRPDYRNYTRRDWHDWHGHNHGNWYYGAWNGNRNIAYDYHRSVWNRYPSARAVGLTTWGVNRAGYLFGCASYVNPYYVRPATGVVIDYSQPLVSRTAASQYVVGTTVAPQPGLTEFDQARADFSRSRYVEALQHVNRAVAVSPKDPQLHEFRSLVQFAMGKYRNAAAAIHPVLAVGPGWNWTTMISLYGDPGRYTTELRALERYQREHPRHAEAAFLLGYHYLTAGHREAALRQFQNASRLNPNDAVTAELVLMTGGEPEADTPLPPEPNQPDLNEADMLGRWTATREDGVSFELTLNQDGNFSWTERRADNRQALQGVFTIDGNTLALEPDSGGVLLAAITELRNGQFRFEQIGNSTSGSRLTFRKS